MAGRRVLIAEDDEVLVKLVSDALEEDFEVIAASDGEEAIQKVQAEKPDLVLLDVRMPVKDGLETCRALRASPEGRDLPIIMITISREPEDVVEAFDAGANDYIVKPFSVAQLRAKTHTWLLRTSQQDGS